MVEKMSTRMRSRRRVISPPVLPPRWGEGVAPPPTPQFISPHISPETSDYYHQRPSRRSRPLRSSDPYYQREQHIAVYEYRFNENRIERWPLDQRPNSAESASPPFEGSSPEYHHHHPYQQRTTTSPESVITYYHQESKIVRRSALRQHGRPSRRPAKSVQWVSDIKKKPQDISSDRRMVKVQVVHCFFAS